MKQLQKPIAVQSVTAEILDKAQHYLRYLSVWKI